VKLSTSQEQCGQRCIEDMVWRGIDSDSLALGSFERPLQYPHGSAGVHAFGFPASLAGVAAAD
jgi:hypothetical protein